MLALMIRFLSGLFPRSWEVFDPRYPNQTYFLVPFKWMAMLLARNGLDYASIHEETHIYDNDAPIPFQLTEKGWTE